LAVSAVSAQAMPDQKEARTAEQPRFQRGVNILGYDPFWKQLTKARFQAKHFAEIRRGGFDFVRVNLLVFDRLDTQGRIDPQWLSRLDWVVENARKAGLGVILDEHDFGACAKDVAMCRVKLSAVWRQLAGRYSAEPPTVAFELLNEPHGALDAETWNAMIPELLAIVRKENPTRTVIVGPVKWNAPSMLDKLRLPANDRHILVTVHYYGPYRFTHQGAPWSRIKDLRGVTWGSAADRKAIGDHFDAVGTWARKNRRPMLVGEFGAYDKSGVPVAMRADYIATIACEAERHGFGWAYWQFDGNFIAWDMKRDTWVEPIKDALIPRRPRARDCTQQVRKAQHGGAGFNG
jgi:endoglucanase